MGEPQYRLEGIVRTRTEQMEDFEGCLDVIFLLLIKTKMLLAAAEQAEAESKLDLLRQSLI